MDISNTPVAVRLEKALVPQRDGGLAVVAAGAQVPFLNG
jgi:hypothetical protein